MEKLSRQELYDRIRETSKEEYILSEMQKLGFWPEDEEQPTISMAIVKEKQELNKELYGLIREQSAFADKEMVLKSIHQKRMQEALEKRAETKARQKAEREAKAKAWAEKQDNNIVYLGEEYSTELNHNVSNIANLKANNLPILHTAKNLADAMQISLGELRFLCYDRKTSKISHYKRFSIPKKDGTLRWISAPMPRLKAAQYWVLEHILYKVTIHEAAQGFVPSKSIVTNAQKHLGQEVLLNMDMKNFFPSVSWKRVRGMFVKLGYSKQLAVILALICTEPLRDEVKLDGQTYYVSKGERVLPQGSPCSPAITNILCRRLDNRLQKFAQKQGVNYSRYADDISLSGAKEALDYSTCLNMTKKIVEEEGFTLHPKKIHLMRKNKRQEVTGIVVNEKLSVSRKQLKKFRALLHQINQTGFDNKVWGEGNIYDSVQGYANFIAMVDAVKGKKYQDQVSDLFKKYPRGKEVVQEQIQVTEEQLVSTTEKQTKAWWSIW